MSTNLVSVALLLAIVVFRIKILLLCVDYSIGIDRAYLFEDLESSIGIANFKKPITGLNFLQIHYKKI